MFLFFEIGVKRALLANFINNTCFFAIYKLTDNNESVIDVALTICYLIESCVYYTYFGVSYENFIKLLIIAIWSIRLGGTIMKNRVLKGFQDPRYDKIFENV